MDETTTTYGGNGIVAINADQGDVPSSLLGIGYDPEVLEREEEDEELSDAEKALAGGDETTSEELPGEDGATAVPQVASGGADQGDVSTSAIGVGYDPATLAGTEELEELADAETLSANGGAYAGVGDAMPEETSGAAATAPVPPEPERIVPPTGLTGWLKREPILAALIVANGPILATLVTSITAEDQTLSILAGVAALVLNVVVSAARNVVTPTADPKLAELTPLRAYNPQ